MSKISAATTSLLNLPGEILLCEARGPQIINCLEGNECANLFSLKGLASLNGTVGFCKLIFLKHQAKETKISLKFNQKTK